MRSERPRMRCRDYKRNRNRIPGSPLLKKKSHLSIQNLKFLNCSPSLNTTYFIKTILRYFNSPFLSLSTQRNFPLSTLPMCEVQSPPEFLPLDPSVFSLLFINIWFLFRLSHFFTSFLLDVQAKSCFLCIQFYLVFLQ